jgi:hypothetical protein
MPVEFSAVVGIRDNIGSWLNENTALNQRHQTEYRTFIQGIRTELSTCPPASGMIGLLTDSQQKVEDALRELTLFRNSNQLAVTRLMLEGYSQTLYDTIRDTMIKMNNWKSADVVVRSKFVQLRTSRRSLGILDPEYCRV